MTSSLAKDFLMHTRIYSSATELKIYHTSSLAVLLTASIKKHCIELLTELGYMTTNVDFIEGQVNDTPLALQERYEHQYYEQRKAMMLNSPLAQFLTHQPGFRLID